MGEYRISNFVDGSSTELDTKHGCLQSFYKILPLL